MLFPEPTKTPEAAQPLIPPWQIAIKRGLPGGELRALVRLIEVLRWVVRTERLGSQEALSKVLMSLEENAKVPLYLAWTCGRPVELIDKQTFGLDRPDGYEKAECQRMSVPIRQDGSMPDGVSPGRSAALRRFRVFGEDLFTPADVERAGTDIDTEDREIMSYPWHQWAAMAMTAEDANLLWGAPGVPLEPFQSFDEVVDFLTTHRAGKGKKKPQIPWKSRGLRRIVRGELTRRERDRPGIDVVTGLAAQLGISRQGLEDAMNRPDE